MPERYLGRNLGKYRVDAVIGTGGFAWVYKAYDPELEIPVALKILKPQYAGDEKFEQRFRREASTAARLRHPNIVKIYAVGREDDAVFFAMDYLPQGLHDRLDVMTTLPEPMLIRMGIDVASALGYAHREGVIHRDIKVDNILFDDHGNAIVADFGIARAAFNYAEVTGTNMVVGTPQYFSPEQARGLALDGRADIYSLGITLYKAATGRLPFLGEDWYEIARQHVEDKPPKPRSINPAVSKEMEQVILGCLEKDPNDRWESGERLCQELATILQERGESVQIRTLATPPMDTDTGLAVSGGPRRARQRRATRLIWSAAGAASLLVAASVLYAGRRGEARGREQSAIASGNSRPTDTAGTQRPAGTSTNPGDSAAASAQPTPPPTPPALVIRASPGVAVSVNGYPLRPADNGTWRLDTLPPGRYTVRGTLNTLLGCATAERTVTATLGDTGERRVNVSPLPCGTLAINASTENKKFQKAPFSYVVRPLGGLDVPRREGPLPLASPLVLPVGRWAVSVRVPECVAFNDEVTVTTNGSRLFVRIICP